jgi:hypothetical protein
MNTEQILLPAVALVAWTAVVWVWMYRRRGSEMRKHRVAVQQLANKERLRQLLPAATAPADNLANLFELPVLFYVGLIVFHVTGTADGTVLVLAWLYVGLRIAHSIIHITYNRVMHRFTVYALSSLVLFGLWGVIGYRLLAGTA